MEGKKVCRLLIVVFAVLNILFFAMYAIELKGMSNLSQELCNDVVINLRGRGISIDEKTINMEIPSESIYSFSTEEFSKHADAVTSGIAKEEFSDIESKTVQFETPGGISVGIYEGEDQSAESELGRMVLSQEEFGIEYTDSRYQLSGSIANSDCFFENDAVSLSYDDRGTVMDFAAALSKDKHLGCIINGAEATDDGVLVSLTQTIDGIKAKDMSVKVLIWDGDILYAYGNWLTYSAFTAYRESLIDGANILYKLPLDTISSVNSEEIVYTVRRSNESLYYILPGWEIGYSDKTGVKSTTYFDAVQE